MSLAKFGLFCVMQCGITYRLRKEKQSRASASPYFGKFSIRYEDGFDDKFLCKGDRVKKGGNPPYTSVVFTKDCKPINKKLLYDSFNMIIQDSASDQCVTCVGVEGKGCVSNAELSLIDIHTKPPQSFSECLRFQRTENMGELQVVTVDEKHKLFLEDVKGKGVARLNDHAIHTYNIHFDMIKKPHDAVAAYVFSSKREWLCADGQAVGFDRSCSEKNRLVFHRKKGVITHGPHGKQCLTIDIEPVSDDNEVDNKVLSLVDMGGKKALSPCIQVVRSTLYLSLRFPGIEADKYFLSHCDDHKRACCNRHLDEDNLGPPPEFDLSVRA